MMANMLLAKRSCYARGVHSKAMTSYSEKPSSLKGNQKRNIRKVGKFYLFNKRVFDIIASIFFLILFSPFMLLTAVLVKLTSRGPVFFKDERVGYRDSPLKVLKFRTMLKGANEHPELFLNEEQMAQYERERKVDDDPRVTKLGKFLRAMSIDELPQFFNILAGNMTFVGPRPVTERELDDNFTEEERELLLSAKPGLISYWGVHGRSKVTWESKERQKLELEYFYHRSFWCDFTLLLRAIPAVLKADGSK